MARREPLSAWLHGVRVATLTSSKPGEVRCTYTADALDEWPLNTPLLSCSLPLLTRPQQGDVFFSGLLPEGQHRQAIADEVGVPTYDTFGLLARFGRDVAGAVVIARDDPGHRPGSVEPYTAETLEAEVAALPERPLGIHDDSELSIAGLQDKLLLVDLGAGRWGRPVHGRPSTHILKVEDRRYGGMAEFEAACLRLAAAAGLTDVEVTLETIAEVPCLIVSRFDRRVTSEGLTRIHQEDACQALARDPEANRRRGKYQSGGGPSLREVADLLDRFAEDPLSELTQLARIATFTVLIGNSDAHGKNIGLLHPTPTSVALAPLYDTVPTMMWPKLRADAAMAINGRRTLDQITVEDVVAEAAGWGLSANETRSAATQTAERIAIAASSPAMPARFAEVVASRCDAFVHGMHLGLDDTAE